MAITNKELHYLESLYLQAKKHKKNLKKYVISKSGITEEQYSKFLQHLPGKDMWVPLFSEDTTSKIINVSDEALDQEAVQSLEFQSEKYVYNKDSDKYIVFLKSSPSPLVIPGATHRAIVSSYSNWNGNALSINEVCRKFKIPRSYFKEYCRVFDLTHDKEPLSTEEILENSIDDSVTKIIEERRSAIHQKFLKKDWQDIQNNSNHWISFRANKLDPFTQFIENWNPPKYEPLKFKDQFTREKREYVYLIGASDWQIGAFTDGEKTLSGEDWNTEIGKQKVREYAWKIKSNIENSGLKFDKAVLCFLGDLNHGLRGTTFKGTPLECDTTQEKQFQAIFDSTLFLIQCVAEIFPKLEIHCVKGNHCGGTDFYPLCIALKSYFRSEHRISFNIYKNRTGMFKVNSTLVIIDHGADADIKAPIPKAGKGQESWIQSLLLSKPELLVGVTHKIFIQGDKHNYSQKEYNDFEFFMFGSLPRSDGYANALNLRNKPRQNCLVIGHEGVSQVHHYYVS